MLLKITWDAVHAISILKITSVPVWEGWQDLGDVMQTGKCQSQFWFSFPCLVFVFFIGRVISLVTQT